MKIKCERDDLVRAMKIILKAVPKRTTNPILECVLLEAHDRKVLMESNDMEMAISTAMDADVKEEGSIAVEANMLMNIASKLPNEVVNIVSDANGTSVKITAGKSKFNILCRNPEDFSKLTRFKNLSSFKISPGLFREMIVGVAFCADVTGQSKNALMAGCNLCVTGDELRLCALDGHRVGLRKAKIDLPMGAEINVTIPQRALVEVSRIIDGFENEMQVEIDNAHVIFTIGETVILSRLLAGDFFDYNKVLKIEPKTVIYTSASDFGNCVNRATVLLREAEKKPLVLEITDGNMHLESISAMGQMSEDLEIEKQGDDLKVGYNPRFLLDVLNAIDHDNIEMRLCGSKTPAVFTEEDADYLYVILPVNIAN